MLIVIDALLFLGFAAACVAIYSVGFHKGVDVIARQELAEQFPDEYPLPTMVKELVDERRIVVQQVAQNNLYHIWRRTQRLPDNPTVRAMYNDSEYQKGLESQKHGSQNN